MVCCSRKEYYQTTSSISFLPYLYYNSSWFMILCYNDKDPFKVLKEKYHKNQLVSIIPDLDDTITDLNFLETLPERFRLHKASIIIDLILTFIVIGFFSVIFLTFFLLKVSLLLFFIELLLNVILIVSLLYLSAQIKKYFFVKYMKKIENYLFEINYDKYIKNKKEWFVDLQGENEYSGLIGIRFFDTNALEVKYNCEL